VYEKLTADFKKSQRQSKTETKKVYEKLTADFKDTYLINKKGNLKNSLRQIYLVYNYLITNNLLSPPLSSMTLSFATDHA
jgi:thymidylate kinase